MVVLMEFSARASGWFSYQAKYWADALFPNLNQKDWIALVTFDMKPRTEVDFTQNKDEVRQALYHLYFPGFSESNVFDALLDTVDRLKDVKGKKSSSGAGQRGGHLLQAHPRSDHEGASRHATSPFSQSASTNPSPIAWSSRAVWAACASMNYLQAENQIEDLFAR